MHCLFGKGYASGGGRLRFRSAKVSAVASSEARPHGFAQKGRVVISDGISLLSTSQEGVGEHVKLESLILAQNERWRQA
jgi:hypothetical protein